MTEWSLQVRPLALETAADARSSGDTTDRSFEQRHPARRRPPPGRPAAAAGSDLPRLQAGPGIEAIRAVAFPVSRRAEGLRRRTEGGGRRAEERRKTKTEDGPRMEGGGKTSN